MNKIFNMDVENNNNSDTTVLPNSKYEDNHTKLRILKVQFFIVLEEFKKYYIFYNKNPEYQEYATMFFDKKTQVQNINSQLFMKTNEIEQETSKLNDVIKKLDKAIAVEKIKNIVLTKKYAKINGTNNGSFEMVDDYKEIYKKLYFSNITLILGILLTAFLLVKNFNVKKTGA